MDQNNAVKEDALKNDSNAKDATQDAPVQRKLSECGFYHLVWSEDEMRKMHDLMPPLADGEVYFVSMSARSKYLTAEERPLVDLGSAEMFNRKLVKEPGFDAMRRVVHSMEVAAGGYESRGGVPVPLHCLVVYWCVTQKATRRALKLFYEKSMTALFEESLPRGLDSLLLNCYHQSSVKAELLDVDFDVPKLGGLDLVKEFLGLLRAKGVVCHVVETRSGYHVLLKRSSLRFNYVAVVDEFNTRAKALYGEKAEVVKNSNEMLPLPGTFQAGFPVRFLDL